MEHLRERLVYARPSIVDSETRISNREECQKHAGLVTFVERYFEEVGKKTLPRQSSWVQYCGKCKGVWPVD